jgi:hypothetical protein
MTDPSERLSAEMQLMVPRPLPPSLLDRIGSELESPARSGDRLLICSICSGAIAACLIVATLFVESQSPAPLQKSAAFDAPRFGDSPLAMARVDDTLLYNLK